MNTSISALGLDVGRILFCPSVSLFSAGKNIGLKQLIVLFHFFLSIGAFSQYGIGQKEIDSLKTILENVQSLEVKNNLYNQLWEATIDDNIQDAKLYAESLVANGELMKNDTVIGRGYNRLAIVYSYLNDYNRSIIYYKKALSIFQDWTEQIDAGQVYVNIGLDYDEQDLVDSSFVYYDKALKSFKKEKDSFHIGSTLRSLSNAYSKMGYYKLGLQKALEATKILETQRDTFELNLSYLEISRIYEELADTLNAEKYLMKSIDYFNSKNRRRWKSSAVLRLAKLYVNNGEKHLEAIKLFEEGLGLSEELDFYINIQLGNFYYAMLQKELGKYDESRRMLLKSLQIAEEKNLKNGIANCLLELGQIYLKEQKLDSANILTTRGLEIATKAALLKEQSKAHLALSGIAAKMDKTQLSLDYYRAYSRLRDSIFDISKSKQIEELKIIYETEKKEVALALQEEEIKTLNEKAKVDKLTKGMYAGGMFTFISVSGLLFFGFRQRIKKNRIAREKQEAIYKQEIAHKKKELASQTLHLVQKNTFIKELMDNLKNIKNSPEKFKMEFRRIVMLLKKENASDKDWEIFKTYFSQVHNDFDQKLRALSSEISEKEIRLAAFIRMNLTTKEIAATLNVLPDSILKSKYRLKKKLGLDRETDLNNFLSTL
ncbi:tetratricopeptide repeat protein [Ulvibacterium marinum]|nr:tetratricopeptide repeat protein [Ulvibacterium marinum]